MKYRRKRKKHISDIKNKYIVLEMEIKSFKDKLMKGFLFD